VYQGTIHADKVIAYLPERSEFEIIQLLFHYQIDPFSLCLFALQNLLE
jgi:hypothetical protein